MKRLMPTAEPLLLFVLGCSTRLSGPSVGASETGSDKDAKTDELDTTT
jgi:hypothetical protein